jgi:hypothetical protein
MDSKCVYVLRVFWTEPDRPAPLKKDRYDPVDSGGGLDDSAPPESFLLFLIQYKNTFQVDI